MRKRVRKCYTSENILEVKKMFPQHQDYNVGGETRNKRQRERDGVSASVEMQSVIKRNREERDKRANRYSLKTESEITHATEIFYVGLRNDIFRLQK